jgi:alpha-galactosidase
MTPEIRAILTNKDLIAIDQDPLGMQGRRVKKQGDLEVWSKQLSDGGRAVALLNRTGAEQDMSVAWEEIGYPGSLEASIRDLWSGKATQNVRGKYSASVPSHGAVVLRIIPSS